jgi:hypothetical protein
MIRLPLFARVKDPIAIKIIFEFKGTISIYVDSIWINIQFGL